MEAAAETVQWIATVAAIGSAFFAWRQHAAAKREAADAKESALAAANIARRSADAHATLAQVADEQHRAEIERQAKQVQVTYPPNRGGAIMRVTNASDGPIFEVTLEDFLDADTDEPIDWSLSRTVFHNPANQAQVSRGAHHEFFVNLPPDVRCYGVITFEDRDRRRWRLAGDTLTRAE